MNSMKNFACFMRAGILYLNEKKAYVRCKSKSRGETLVHEKGKSFKHMNGRFRGKQVSALYAASGILKIPQCSKDNLNDW